MHPTSYARMAEAVGRYIKPLAGRPLTIVDIGSYDVNASYKPLLNDPSWRYVGVDIAAGPNVDVVLESPYRLPFDDGTIDVVVSGQTFEHIEFFWLTWQEIVRILKPGGHAILIAPSRGQEHRYPVDCWRFYPDGFRALGKLGNLEVLEVNTSFLPAKPGFWFRLLNRAKRDPWGDTIGVFRKP